MNKVQQLILVILDGWGMAKPNRGNAIAIANTPVFDSLKNKYPYTELCAHGRCVGLPKNQVGNSEAGHLNLGAGRVIKGDGVYISESIQDGTFFKNPIFYEGIRHLKNKKQAKPKVHLLGLVTEENSAHSSPEQWLSMIKFLDQNNVDTVFLHLFTDGRDSSQHAAIKILERFQQHVKHDHMFLRIKVRIASVSGRFYAMDRTKKWERIEKVYDLLTLGKGLKASSAKQAVVQAYNREETDEFITPSVIVDKNQKPVATIGHNDLVIFMNLRSDRARELTKAFVQAEFNKKNPGSFKRRKLPKTFFIALTDFGPDLDNIRTAYPSHEIKNSLPVALSGLKQLYISETEKYAHVTFFFNGGYDHAVAGEKRVLISSSKIAHYDYRYEMRSKAICDRVLQEIKNNKPDFIVVNFCNADMLGHTGNIKATIKGLEFLDKTLGRLIKTAKEKKYTIIVTADHGNAEKMINLDTDEIETSHTTNLVPFIIISSSSIKLKPDGQISDIGPTILKLMNVKKPKQMTGTSLIRK